MKIVITGSSGFIGSKLVQRFRTIGDVVGIDRKPDKYTTKTLDLIYSTIKDELKDADLLIHCAAIVGVANHNNLEKRAMLKNSQIDWNIIESIFAAENPNLKVVYASSSEIYGWSKTPMEESHISNSFCMLDERKAYSAEKLWAEYMFKTAVDSDNLLILRLFNVSCGNGKHGFISKMMHDALTKGFIEASTGIRAPCDVDYVAEAVYLLCNRFMKSENRYVEYNIGNEDNVIKMEQVANKIRDNYAPNAYISVDMTDTTCRLPNCQRLKFEIGDIKNPNIDNILRKAYLQEVLTQTMTNCEQQIKVKKN